MAASNPNMGLEKQAVAMNILTELQTTLEKAMHEIAQVSSIL